MTVTKKRFAKKLCAYSAAVGAAATAGMALDANAAPITYDTEASPVDVHSSFNTLPNGQNMAAINPTTLGATTTVATTTPTAAGLIGHATGATDNSGISNAQLAGTVYFRYEIFSEPSATWGKSGTQFGILTGAGNGLYAVQVGTAPSTQPASQGGIGGFVEGDIIGDDDTFVSGNTVGADAITQAYSMGPGAATQADTHGFGAFATGSEYNIVSGIKYLGFRIDNRNGFVKVHERFNDRRNNIKILGWGLESTPFVPIVAQFATGGPAVPEPATLAMLAIGGVGLLALRRRRQG